MCVHLCTMLTLYVQNIAVMTVMKFRKKCDISFGKTLQTVKPAQ